MQVHFVNLMNHHSLHISSYSSSKSGDHTGTHRAGAPRHAPLTLLPHQPSAGRTVFKGANADTAPHLPPKVLLLRLLVTAQMVPHAWRIL